MTPPIPPEPAPEVERIGPCGEAFRLCHGRSGVVAVAAATPIAQSSADFFFRAFSSVRLSDSIFIAFPILSFLVSSRFASQIHLRYSLWCAFVQSAKNSDSEIASI